MPKVSVIIPVYNASRFLKKTIDSVLNQSFGDFEVVAIDDCSKDDSFKILESYKKRDKRIKVYQNSENIGVAQTRNRGIELAEAEWIAFLDSDDYWAEDKLKKQLGLHDNNPECLFSYTASAFCNEQGDLYDYILHVKEKITFEELLKKNLISCSSVIIRKDIIKKYKMLNDDVHEDYVAWLDILKDYTFAIGLDEPLLVYRFVSNSKSSNRIKSAFMMIRSYRAIGLNWFYTIFCTIRYSFYSISYRRNFN